MDERCAKRHADPAVNDFSCDALGHDMLAQPDHIDDDARHVDDYRAVALAEGFEQGTEAEVVAAWQHLVDTGLVWQLQGWFGRRATELLEQGIIHK